MIRAAIKRSLGVVGYELRRSRMPAPATNLRPVGDLVSVLEDLRARGFYPKTIADVGANRGDWSCAVATVFPGASFHLFEPVPAFREPLLSFTRTHPGSRAVLSAVGAEPGSLTLNVVTADGAATSGSTALSTDHDGRYVATATTVPVTTLDAEVASGRMPIPDLLKIDVEGYEPQVLAGTRSLLGQTEVLILEVSLYAFWGQPIFHEIVADLASTGYLVYDFAGFNRRPKDGALGQADVLFVRKGSPLRRETAWDA